MSGYQYQIIRLVYNLRDEMQVQDNFDAIGKTGWELVAVSDGRAYFKRPK